MACLVNGSSSLDDTYREYSVASLIKCLDFGAKVKVAAGLSL